MMPLKEHQKMYFREALYRLFHHQVYLFVVRDKSAAAGKLQAMMSSQQNKYLCGSLPTHSDSNIYN